jgi:hypothetical protein
MVASLALDYQNLLIYQLLCDLLQAGKGRALAHYGSNRELTFCTDLGWNSGEGKQLGSKENNYRYVHLSSHKCLSHRPSTLGCHHMCYGNALPLKCKHNAHTDMLAKL